MNWQEIKERHPKAFDKFYKWQWGNQEYKFHNRNIYFEHSNYPESRSIDIWEISFQSMCKGRRFYDFFDSNSILVLVKYLKSKFKYYIIDFNEDLVEEWRGVKGYEGLYEISNKGKIRSLEHQVKFGTGSRISDGKTLKPSPDKQGYLFVYLSKEGKTKRKDIHREVAKSFLPDFDEALEVNHLNGLKDDNWVTNLEMVTASENQKHAQGLHLHNGNKQAGFISRTEAEEQAFIKAFEILEKKL